jgi:hypothetical protein
VHVSADCVIMVTVKLLSTRHTPLQFNGAQRHNTERDHEQADLNLDRYRS